MGRWVPMAGRVGGTVPTIVLSPAFGTDGTAFAATNTGLFRSRDEGKSWEVSGKGIGSFAIQSIALSRGYSADRTLWVGAADGGIYRSTDRGDSWALLAHLGRGSAVVGVAASSDHSTLMAGTLADGLFASTDGGRRWKPRNAGLPDPSVISLALSPAFKEDRTAFVAVSGGLYRTTDGGGSWQPSLPSVGEDAVQCVAISPSYPTDRTVLAGTESRGLLRSRDGGVTWHPTNAGIPRLCINDLALSPDFQQDATVAAATGQGVALSKDAGDSWQLVGAKSEIVLGLDVARATTHGRTLLAGIFDKGILRSEDEGESWEEANAGLTANYLIGLSLSPAFETDHTIFAWGPSEGVFQTKDGSESWQPSGAGMEDTSVLSLAISPQFASDGGLYAGTSAGLFLSQDRGVSWQQFALQGQEVPFVTLSPAFQRDQVIVAAADNGIQWSADGGTTWKELDSPPGSETLVALSLALDSRGRPVLLAGDWREPHADLRARVRVLSRTLPDSPWVTQFHSYTSTRIAALGIPDSFEQDGRFFIGSGECVYRAMQGARERTREGETPLWLPSGVGSKGFPVVSLAAAPGFAKSHSLLASAGEGVYISENEGAAWHRLGNGPGDRSVVAVVPTPDFATSASVYALAIGGRLWKWEKEEDEGSNEDQQ